MTAALAASLGAAAWPGSSSGGVAKPVTEQSVHDMLALCDDVAGVDVRWHDSRSQALTSTAEARAAPLPASALTPGADPRPIAG